MNKIPGRYLPMVNEVVWARWDVLRPYRRAVVTDVREYRTNRTAVDFVWLEDDLDHERRVEAGAYSRITVPTVDLGEPFPALIQPWEQGEAPLIRLEMDWRTDVRELPADGTLLTARQAAARLGLTYNSFAVFCAPGDTHFDDFPPPWYSFMYKKMWRAADIDEWRARHPKKALGLNTQGTQNPNGRRARLAKSYQPPADASE